MPLSLSARAASISMTGDPVGPGALFPPASTAWGAAVGRSVDLGGLSGMSEVIRGLKPALNPSDSDLARLGPVASALAAEGYTAESFSALDAVTRRVLLNFAATKGAASVSKKLDELAAQAAKGEISADELSQAVGSLRALGETFGSYLDEQGAEKLTKAQSAAEKRLGEAKNAQMSGALARTKQALGASKNEADAGVAAEDGSVAVARGLIKELLDGTNPDYLDEVMIRIKAHAARYPTEVVERVFVEGLAQELRSAGGVEYSESVAQALTDLAKPSRFPDNRLIALKALIKEASDVGNSDYADAIWTHVADLAVDMDGPAKGLAVAGLLKDVRRSGNTEYIEILQAHIARIGESAGGLANIPMPSEEPASKPGAEAVERVRKGGFRLGQQLSAGVKAHPFGAFFAALAGASTLVTMAQSAAPVLAVAAVLAAFLFMTTKGLFHDSPFANFFQLLILGDFAESAAKAAALAPLSPATWLVGAFALGLGVRLAVWGFKSDHTILAWFLNLILIGGIASALFGHAIASVTFK